ncbi:MAG: hypothetical protein M1816_005315 [Peltula sp. TS41687]|nr:MAG: hypothetical protein M1816_005315 [Peltula sp. TS41687]
MTTKRSRAIYEADLQAQQSPYVIYGTPLPPLDPDVRDDGSYVPIWKQEVTDERGRKRLHGAFTGGFSAGYFNTVGSKEGWSPSTFVSSRSNRQKDGAVAKAQRQQQQRPEDFMDEEDLADAAEAQKLQTSGSFAGLGLTGDDAMRRDALMDVLKAEGETMGVKLLRKMGWKEGQGVGPKVRRKARLGGQETGDGGEATHWFAPENSALIAFTRKNDQKGLGYEGEVRLGTENGISRSGRLGGTDDDEDEEIGHKSWKAGKQNGTAKGGFGVGILNDTGSDDEDPYEIGPRIKYNKVIGGSSKKKGKLSEGGRSKANSANPLLRSKPVFISRKASSSVANPGFRRCHDGRLPLDGFVLSTTTDIILSSAVAPDKRYPPPEIPKDWKSSKQPSSSTNETSYRSTAEAARASTLDPKSRASLLGEAQLPGKSVFDFLSPAARDRIASASGHSELPPGLGESAPKGFTISEAERQKNLRDLLPDLDKEVAIKALGRGIGGWMPYAEDEQKRARYRYFLETKAGLRTELPIQTPGMSEDDWINELREFAHAAQLFKPMTGMMASRFTSSSSRTASNVPDSSTGSSSGDNLLRDPSNKPEDPAEAAAKFGMYGPMTRSIQQFYPTRLLCKRFNVKPPTHVQPGPASNTDAGGTTNPSGTANSTTLQAKSLELVSKAAVDDILRESELGDRSSVTLPLREVVVVDAQTNPALEAKRPGEAVFKAIFGSDDDDD